MALKNIVVTGASGKAGRAITKDLVAHGYTVSATDAVAPPADLGAPFLRADLTDYGQTVEILHGADAVVHMAAIPSNGIYTPGKTFTDNTAMNSNVFLAAAQLGLQRVVWASSETTLGLSFTPETPPRYAPVDEDHFPYPTSTYALSKVVGETLAEHISGWSGIPFVGLRFSNIFAPDGYERVPSFQGDATIRQTNLWGYIDVRDVAASCRNGLEASTTGSENFIIAAADTIMNRPSGDLMREVFPDVQLRREVGEHETLLSIAKAREMLGFLPQHSWRDEVSL